MNVEEIGFVHVRLPLRSALARMGITENAPEAGGEAGIAGFSRSCSLPPASSGGPVLSSQALPERPLPTPATG